MPWLKNSQPRAAPSATTPSTPSLPTPAISADRPDSMLDPDAIALSYWNVLQQPRSAWSWEQELRPWVEKF